MKKINIIWPNGKETLAKVDTLWLKAALDAGISIPTGCLGGSCGACEIEVDGKVLRACISKVEESKSNFVVVEEFNDPYW